MLMKISANDFSYIARKVKNIPHRLRREIYRIPPFQALKEQLYQKALNDYAQFLPQLDAQGQTIVEELHQEGTCVIPIENLGIPSTAKMMSTAFALAEKLKRIKSESNNADNCEVGSSPEDLREFTEMLFWALEPKLLDIVENYIGLPILYQGFAMRKSVADGKYSGVRRWHIDWEDRRIIKIIIYLNDVVEGGGPYNYIPRNMTAEAIAKLNYYNLGYLSDAEMATAISESDWQACLAPKGSVVISDTSSVFHRAQPPTEHERFSITFCYTSAMPQVIWRGRKISPEQWEIIEQNLSQRQKECLPKKRLAEFT